MGRLLIALVGLSSAGCAARPSVEGTWVVEAELMEPPCHGFVEAGRADVFADQAIALRFERLYGMLEMVAPLDPGWDEAVLRARTPLGTTADDTETWIFELPLPLEAERSFATGLTTTIESAVGEVMCEQELPLDFFRVDEVPDA